MLLFDRIYTIISNQFDRIKVIIMRAQDRATARRQLDKRLNLLRKKALFARPPRGWIKAIRESLGMTTRQFAGRIGVVQSRAVDIEKAEVTGSITLDSLERAARALDCELVYARAKKSTGSDGRRAREPYCETKTKASRS